MVCSFVPSNLYQGAGWGYRDECSDPIHSTGSVRIELHSGFIAVRISLDRLPAMCVRGRIAGSNARDFCTWTTPEWGEEENEDLSHSQERLIICSRDLV